MPSSKPTTIVDDGPFTTPSEATRFEKQLRGMHARSKETIGTFQDYARAILKREGGLPEANLRAVLRDPGTSNLYQRYLDFRLFGPLLLDAPFPGKRDRRG